MIQTKLVLAKGVRSKQDLELMQYGTLKIMLTQHIHVEEELGQVCWHLNLANCSLFAFKLIHTLPQRSRSISAHREFAVRVHSVQP